MISHILTWLSGHLNTRLPGDISHPVVTANVPSYQSEGETRVAPNRIILSLAGFSGSMQATKRSTGFHLGTGSTGSSAPPVELKVVLIADFQDEHYLKGIDLLEDCFRLLQQEEAQEAELPSGKIRMEIRSDAGTRGDLAMMIRGASGKFLPALSYSIKVIS